MLQPIPIARFHPHRRVQREPIHIRAQRPLHERFVLRPAANPLVPFPGPFAERRAALHRRGGEFDQQLVVTSSVRPIDPFLRLAMLRAEFDGQYGERERWAAPLGALVGVHAAVPAAVTGGNAIVFVVMLMKLKLLLGAAAVLLAAAALSLSIAGERASPPTVRHRCQSAPIVRARPFELLTEYDGVPGPSNCPT